MSCSHYKGKPPKEDFSGLFTSAWTSYERMKSYYNFLGNEQPDKNYILFS